MLRPETWRKLLAATGSGKTSVEQAISLSEVFAEPGRRVLIAAPYRDIGCGFRSGRVLALDRAPWARLAALAVALSVAAVALACAWSPYALLLLSLLVPACRLTCTRPWRTKDAWWRPAVLFLLSPIPACRWRTMVSRFGRATVVNKCDETDDAIRDVEEFLRGDPWPRIMVCCQASIANAWARVEAGGPEAAAAAIRNLTLTVDEGHWVEATSRTQNGVGQMVYGMFHSGDKTARICLATATFCRGGRAWILDPADDAKFAQFRYHFGEHWRENMPSVRRVAWEYVTYGPEGWDDALAEVLRENGRGTLVYVPPPTSSAASPESGGVPGKLRDLDRVRAAIGKSDPDTDDIVDLVTDDDGADNSAELKRAMGRIRSGDNPDYIVALNMMKMGSDWQNLRSVVVLAPGGSRGGTAQQFGRTSREPVRVPWRTWLRLRLHDESRRGPGPTAAGWWRRLRRRLSWLWNPRPDKGRISFTLFFRGLDAGATDEEVRRAYSAHFAAMMPVLLMECEIAMPPRVARADLRPAIDWLESPHGSGFMQAVFVREGGADPATCVAVARLVMDEWRQPPIPDDVRAGLEIIVRHLNRPTRQVPVANHKPTWASLQATEVVDAGLDEVRPGSIGALKAHMATIGGPDTCERYIKILRGLPGYTEAQVAAALAARMESEPGWHPTARDATQIPGLPPGTNCHQLDGAIKQRFRGFTGEGDSLLKLCQRNGLLPSDAPDYTEAQVVAALAARMESEPGWHPARKDTTQIPGLPPGTTCQQLDGAIKHRLRGFTGEGDSLLKLCQRNGLLPPDAPDYTEAQVVAALAARMESEPGWHPTGRDTTQIPGLPPGTNCQQLNSAITQRLRGFTGEGDSLLKLCQRNGLLPPDAPDYTEAQVAAALAARMESEPGWHPTGKDTTQIPGLPPGTTCRQLDAAIRRRNRGFTGEGNSLLKLCQRNGLLPPDASDYTEAQVVAALAARMESEPGWHPTGKDTTQIPGLPPGTNCRQLNRAIKRRLRGFTIESGSLSKMLRRNGYGSRSKRWSKTRVRIKKSVGV